MADTLLKLHLLTQGWPQRPGWRSSTYLLYADTGTRINLNTMRLKALRDAVQRGHVLSVSRLVLHGDPNPNNILMTVKRVALIDWDESHTDVPDLDLVLPYNAAALDISCFVSIGCMGNRCLLG